MMQPLLSGRKPQLTLGIDISQSSVSAVELSFKEGHTALEAYGFIDLPLNAVEGYIINNTDEVATCIKTLIRDSGIKSKQALVALPDAAVITKILQASTKLSERELEQFVLIEADKMLPHSCEELLVDFEVKEGSQINPNLIDVLMVASRSLYVRTRTEALNKAGLSVQAVDVASFALERSLQGFANVFPEDAKDKVLAVIDIQDDTLTFYAFYNMKLIYTREDALGSAVDGLSSLLSRIKRALQFFSSSSNYLVVSHLLLAGKAMDLIHLSSKIQAGLGITTSLAHPLNYLPNLNHRDSQTLLKGDAPSLLVAYGLALRKSI